MRLLLVLLWWCLLLPSLTPGRIWGAHPPLLRT
jgi:hypothetical protein